MSSVLSDCNGLSCLDSRSESLLMSPSGKQTWKGWFKITGRYEKCLTVPDD